MSDRKDERGFALEPRRLSVAFVSQSPRGITNTSQGVLNSRWGLTPTLCSQAATLHFALAACFSLAQPSMQHAEASRCNSSRLFSNLQVVKEELSGDQSETGTTGRGRLLLLQKMLFLGKRKKKFFIAEAGCVFFPSTCS